MNTEAEIEALRKQVVELQATVTKLIRSPYKLYPWYRKASVSIMAGLLAVVVSHQLVDDFGPFFGVTGNAVRTYSISTPRLTLEDVGRGEERYGHIDGRHSKIIMRSGEGEVDISPSGIRLEGPDGVLILKPEKK